MPYILKKYYSVRHLVFFGGEGALIFLAISGVYFYLGEAEQIPGELPLLISKAVLVTVIFQFCLYLFDLYDLGLAVAFSDTFARILQAFGFGCILLALLYFLFPPIMISTRVFFLGCLMTGGMIGIWRFSYDLILNRQLFARNILLLGSGMMAENIAGEIRRKRDTAYRIAAQVDEGATGSVARIPYFSGIENLKQICQERNIKNIVVTLDNKRGKMPIAELMACKLLGIQIITGIKFYEGLAGKIMVEQVNPSWIIFSEGFRAGQMVSLIKRLTDISAALFGLIISLPVTLLSALFIKLESPGPIFYLQERVGEKGKPFRVVKFRSMRTDAEEEGPVWAEANDARVTRFGRLIRKVRIDEIPQMWNVLKGEMSFVGPRPERPFFVERLEKKIPYYSLRHTVKPGITGWAQICYPYGASEEDALRKLEFDLYYIKNMSLRMDLGIIFLTAKTVLFQKGAR